MLLFHNSPYLLLASEFWMRWSLSSVSVSVSDANESFLSRCITNTAINHTEITCKQGWSLKSKYLEVSYMKTFISDLCTRIAWRIILREDSRGRRRGWSWRGAARTACGGCRPSTATPRGCGRGLGAQARPHSRSECQSLTRSLRWCGVGGGVAMERGWSSVCSSLSL